MPRISSQVLLVITVTLVIQEIGIYMVFNTESKVIAVVLLVSL
jgi:hypothetical protein